MCHGACMLQLTANEERSFDDTQCRLMRCGQSHLVGYRRGTTGFSLSQYQIVVFLRNDVHHVDKFQVLRIRRERKHFDNGTANQKRATPYTVI